MAACKAKTKAGKPCRATGILDNGYCMAHQPAEVREKLGFIANNGKGGRKKLPTVIDTMRQQVEDRIDEICAPFWKGLEAQRRVGTTTNDDGEEVPVMVDDLSMQQASARELLDRVYGKPKQALEHSGGIATDPVDTAPITNAKREKEVKRILAQQQAAVN